MAGRNDAEIRSYFATPLVILDLPEGADINQALRAAIFAREQASPGVAHSNLGGWQSDADFLSWGGEAGALVVGRARELANRLTCDRRGAPVAIEWKINAWANVNRTGHANEFHTHPGAYWSASYYVDDGYGPATGPEAAGGEFEIQDPRGVAPAMYAPLLAFATQGGRSVGASELIPPKAGRLMIFPAWLSHGVRPYAGAGVRISVALNFSL